MSGDYLYLSLVWLTGGVILGCTVLGYQSSRDCLHPVLFLGIPLAYPYVIAPLVLHSNGILALYLPMREMPFVQFVVLLGVASLLLGSLLGGRLRQNAPRLWIPPRRLRSSLRRAAVTLGGVGITGYVVSVYTSGGFIEAYGLAHQTEGLEVSGYIRDLRWFLVPAIILWFLARAGRPLRPLDWCVVGGLAVPLAFRAIVTGGRGTAFVIVTTITLGWYFTRGTRPRFITFLGGAAALALLLLVLVTHRDVLYIGGDGFQFKGVAEVVNFAARDSRGQEYIYGAGTIINSRRAQEYDWGGRYVEKLVIRAIPYFMWPSQYEDFRKFWGMQGFRLAVSVRKLGWEATPGASQGLIGDIWRQLWWFFIPVLALVGWFVGRIWQKAVVEGRYWLVYYVIAVALSLYLTQQGFSEWLWRLLFVGGGASVVWWWIVSPRLRKLERVERVRKARQVRAAERLSRLQPADG